jgi:hypothetical protein
MNLVELIIVAILSSSVIVLSAVLLVQHIRHNKLIQASVQLVIDKAALSDEVDRLSFIINNFDDLNNGFVKFLSESRESAFQYISDVQSVIGQLKTAMSLNDEESISKSYKELISFLPEDNTATNVID